MPRVKLDRYQSEKWYGEISLDLLLGHPSSGGLGEIRGLLIDEDDRT
jgi:hypothetical protein